jgi:hypothetical protein
MDCCWGILLLVVEGGKWTKKLLKPFRATKKKERELRTGYDYMII